MVTGDAQQAAALVAAGTPVVLIVAADDPAVIPRPGVLVVMVGDRDDPAVQAAAADMHSELFSRVDPSGGS